MTASALVVANSTDSDAGYLGERLQHHGFSLFTVMRDLAETPAAVPPDAHLVLLLGSEWSVHAPVDAGARDRECTLVRSAQASGVPVLGICYGAQVVAHAYGGSVSRAARPEVGLVAVRSDDEGLVPSGRWTAFHTDVVDPPPRAEVIARNACGIQAFALPGVLAVQFHPEVRPDTLADWSHRFPELLTEAGVDGDRLVEQAWSREPQARAAASALVDAFLDRGAPTAYRSAVSPPASKITSPYATA
jgi:GMP synthase-like glutamine amidotransferase